jgi:hypothetical protein
VRGVNCKKCSIRCIEMGESRLKESMKAWMRWESPSGNDGSFIGLTIFIGTDEYSLNYIHRYLN